MDSMNITLIILQIGHLHLLTKYNFFFKTQVVSNGKKIGGENFREYNIITNRYTQDNDVKSQLDN